MKRQGRPFTTTGLGRVRVQIYHTADGRIHQALVTFLDVEDEMFLRNLGKHVHCGCPRKCCECGVRR